MVRNRLLPFRRYVISDVGLALIEATSYLGLIESVWLVRDSRHGYVCLCHEAPSGPFEIPRIDFSMWFEGVGPDGECVDMGIYFGDKVLPIQENILCRESAS